MLEPHGGLVVRVGDVPVLAGDSLLLMDEAWKPLDTVMRATARLERRESTTIARYETPLTTLAKTVTSGPEGVEARWEFKMKPDARGRQVELCIALPSAVLADFPASGKTHDAIRSQEEIRVSSFLGELVFDVRGSSAPWSLDDMRKVEWAKAFRLRFAPAYDPAKGLDAVAVLRVKALPTRSPAFVPLDVAGAGNRGLSDQAADDGQGGWTDQGANDLRVFAPGARTFRGIPFRVGEKVLLLRGKERPAFPVEGAPLPVNSKLARLYLLQTAAWSADFCQPIAEYVLTYADGKTERIPVRYGVDVNDWWGASEPLEARLAWSGDNGSNTVGLYLMRWENPRPDVEVRSLQARSRESASVPVLLAATGIVPGALAPEQVALLDTAFTQQSEADVRTDGWFPAPIAWHDGIEAGSALDVSFLNDAPAGKHGFLRVREGRFVFEKQAAQPVRFWGTNAALFGPFPAKEDAPGIAACLARQGVNMVRLHLYAVYENTLIAPDGSLDAGALDRFCYFIAQLGSQGIYSYMDLNDGMFYDRLVGKKLPAGNDKLKVASLFNRDLIEAQKKLARLLFTHVNPYTGLRLCDDPAIALWEVTNENSLTMGWGTAMGWGTLKARLPEPYYAELRGLWRDWLRARGETEPDLPDTLGGEGSDPLSRRFAAELQRRYLEEMRDHLRALGVKAPICGTNITFTPGDLWASQGMDYTNDHNYWDHPNVSARPMTYSNRPAVKSAPWSLPMIPTFARTKVRGKPVVASEWNYCFPNDYRCEGLPTMAAYAAYQDWDGLLFYCATGSFDAGRWERFHTAPKILVHSQQTDPATWGLSQVCALLYRRGDVRVGRRVVPLRIDDTALWENRTPLGRVPFLPALARVETELGAGKQAAWLEPADATKKPEEVYRDVLAALKDRQSSDRRIVNDTGEIARDAEDGILTVDTPRAQMASGFLSRPAEVKLGNVAITCETRFATVALASLDGKPIAQSRRMLLVAVANARNTGQKCSARRLESVGDAPVLAEPVAARLSLRLDAPAGVRVYSLDTLTGKRLAPVPAKVEGPALTLRIGPEAKTIYYEVTR